MYTMYAMCSFLFPYLISKIYMQVSQGIDEGDLQSGADCSAVMKVRAYGFDQIHSSEKKKQHCHWMILWTKHNMVLAKERSSNNKVLLQPGHAQMFDVSFSQWPVDSFSSGLNRFLKAKWLWHCTLGMNWLHNQLAVTAYWTCGLLMDLEPTLGRVSPRKEEWEGKTCGIIRIIISIILNGQPLSIFTVTIHHQSSSMI